MLWTDMLRYFPESVRSELTSSESPVLEIRMRACRRTEVVREDGRMFVGDTVSADHLRKIAIRMMDYSYYSRESELAEGYFTMQNGCRVGVCGTFARMEDGTLKLQSIASMCIRIAREVRGCSLALIDAMQSGDCLRNTLVISRPGLGKTTLLRDAARMLSENGYAVAVADERHELAACRDGIPTLDIGPRTDVADGGVKHKTMMMLIRSMSPQIIITDEIGCEADIQAVYEASRCGVSVLTSAHAASLEDLERGPLKQLMHERIFATIVLLKDKPGRISKIWNL